jgi:hypothetical protein
MYLAEQVAEHPRLTKPLQRIVYAHENAVAYECKYDRIGMYGSHPAKGRGRQPEIDAGIKEGNGSPKAGQHPDDTPAQNGIAKPFYRLIIIIKFLYLHTGFVSVFDGEERLEERGSSSKRIRRGGAYPSSNCLSRTDQIKAARKTRATDRLAISRMIITCIL